jgi:tellurite resistance protein TerC
MVTITGIDPILMWTGFIVMILLFLVLDLKLFNKKDSAVSVKQALIWTAVWVALALLFGVFVFFEFGLTPAIQYLTGYVLEKALSFDNIFVIFLIFLSFKIEQKYQHKILFWGIIGALVMRGLLIWLGVSLVTRFEWIFYIFGIFLIYSGINMLFKKDDKYDPHDSWIIRIIRKAIHITKDHDGKFIVRHNNKIAITILFVALIAVEFTDIIFAFDSIPAILGITSDPFIVFTSNIFAILGLRSLYFVIAKVHDMFVYLNYGLAAILVFIGLKMIIEEWLHIPLLISLGMVFLILTVSIIASIILGKKT